MKKISNLEIKYCLIPKTTLNLFSEALGWPDLGLNMEMQKYN